MKNKQKQKTVVCVRAEGRKNPFIKSYADIFCLDQSVTGDLNENTSWAKLKRPDIYLDLYSVSDKVSSSHMF